jgi:hypothetical protein
MLVDVDHKQIDRLAVDFGDNVVPDNLPFLLSMYSTVLRVDSAMVGTCPDAVLRNQPSSNNFDRSTSTASTDS